MIEFKTKRLLSRGDRFVLAKDRKYYTFVVMGVNHALNGHEHSYLIMQVVTP